MSRSYKTLPARPYHARRPGDKPSPTGWDVSVRVVKGGHNRKNQTVKTPKMFRNEVRFDGKGYDDLDPKCGKGARDAKRGHNRRNRRIAKSRLMKFE